MGVRACLGKQPPSCLAVARGEIFQTWLGIDMAALSIQTWPRREHDVSSYREEGVLL